MSTFHENGIKIDDSMVITCLCWKETTPSYLAVGTDKGIVKFYWSDCRECTNFAPLSYQSRTSGSRSKDVISLTFHPILDILIAIWSDGVMRSWNNEQGIISNQMSPHSVKNDSYLNILFNKNGTRLISTDYRGVISIWQCANNGQLSLLYTFKLKYGCSHVTLLNNDNDEEEITSFYLSNNEGKIYLTTDDGHCDDILEIEPQQKKNKF